MNSTIRTLLTVMTGAVLTVGAPLTSLAAEKGKTRVLVIVGGHDFETNQFHTMFRANPKISYKMVEHPNAHAKLKPEAVKAYDVIVLYDMWQKIDEEAKADFVNALKSGKGLVSLHHSLANYQKWPEFEKIVGGKYYLQKTVVNGVEKPVSTWKHDVDIKVSVADQNHPVTKGVKDFEIHDEAYGKYDMAEGSHTLLTTDHPLCAKNVAWANQYGPARVVYIQLGHDHYAFEDENYRRLVGNAIDWVAKK